jgi:hypothetical protein
MERYNLQIVFSGKFYHDLEFLKDYCREIIKLDEPEKCYDNIKLYAYDIILEFTNRQASTYMERLEINKDNILKVRREHTKVINENYSKFDTYNTMDPEILLLRPKKLNTFLKYYKHAYKFYKDDDYKKSFELIKYALTINPKDYRTKQLFDELKNKLNDI